MAERGPRQVTTTYGGKSKGFGVIEREIRNPRTKDFQIDQKLQEKAGKFAEFGDCLAGMQGLGLKPFKPFFDLRHAYS
eukprot:3112280-Pleurochrysis_carterae.AAC.4